MNIGPTGRRIFIVLFSSLALFNIIIALALILNTRTTLGLACLCVSLMETVTASLLWAAAPVARRW